MLGLTPTRRAISCVYARRDFFQRFDVLLTPVAATAALPHDHNPDRDQRFSAGLASLCELPAKAAQIGQTTIEFARLIAGEIGGLTPPTGYN